MLQCSEWWVKEQARRRRIPYSWIGGSYLFTEAHVVEIVRLFEVAPVREAEVAEVHRLPARRTARDDGGQPRLRARPPRRARAASGAKTTAA
jgi:hypothetical protein